MLSKLGHVLQRYVLIAIGIVLGALSLNRFLAAARYRSCRGGRRIDAFERIVWYTDWPDDILAEHSHTDHGLSDVAQRRPRHHAQCRHYCDLFPANRRSKLHGTGGWDQR